MANYFGNSREMAIVGTHNPHGRFVKWYGDNFDTLPGQLLAVLVISTIRLFSKMQITAP